MQGISKTGAVLYMKKTLEILDEKTTVNTVASQKYERKSFGYCYVCLRQFSTGNTCTKYLKIYFWGN